MRVFLVFFLIVSSQSLAQVDVTFRVDMQYQTVSTDGVHIAGSMQGWDPSSTPLSDIDGDGIWEVTLALSENSLYEYKFINGNSWGTDEAINGSCSTENNRQLLTTNENMLLPAYVFNSCDFTAYGCTDQNASNHDPMANTDDGSCTYTQIEGCIDSVACNFDLSATQDDGSCVYASPGYDCDSNCVAQDIDWIGDQNLDGFLSIDPTTNQTYFTIESYPNVGIASININGDVQPMNYSDWGNNAHWYVSLDLTPSNVYNWSVEVANLCATSQSTTDSFTTDCQNVINGNSQDLGCGCGEPEPQAGYDCQGNCIDDADLDGICDEFEIEGCTDSQASNFNDLATNDDGSCQYTQIEGCIDSVACNFDLSATQDDGSCVYASPGYDCDSNCVAQDIDWIGDQNLDGFLSIDPTTNQTYFTIESYPNVGIASININGDVQPMNYSDWGNNAHWYVSLDLTPSNVYNWSVEVANLCATSQSTTDSFTTDCQNVINGNSQDLGCGCGEPEPQAGYDCQGNCIDDADLDGICDEFEIEGCTDSIACNFNQNATEENGSCVYFQFDQLADTGLCSSSTIEIAIDESYDSYLWSNGDTTNFIQISEAGTYFVTVNHLGCQITDTINVSYLPIPYIDVGDVFNVCSGSFVDLEVADDWSSTLLIDFESGDTIFDNNLGSLANAGQYQLFVTDSEGCIGYDIFEIINSPLPGANFDYSISENLLITNNLSTNADYFEWTIIHHEEITIDSAQNLSLNIELCDNDTIMLVAHNNCGTDTMVSIVNPTKIVAHKEGFSIYPNPFNDVIYFSGYENFKTYYLRDINGKLIKSGNTSNILNFKALDKGVYNLILFKNNNYFSRKLIKY